MEDPVVRLERNLYGHPSAGLLWDRQFEKALLEPGWEKVPIWECFFLTEKKEYSYLCLWTGLRLAGKTENTEPTLEILS